MKYSFTIKINFRGGIISPGELYNILVAAGKAGITKVKFGLRQQLLIEVVNEEYATFTEQLQLLNIDHETDSDRYPNMMSSYPAEEVFINKTWLSEGVYKDIFDLMDYKPQLKINVSDSNQSFTPILTGNINWVASLHSPHFWHVFVRFPKTNVVYEWDQLVYTNDIARLSKHIETIIMENPGLFYDKPDADGKMLFKSVQQHHYITRAAEAPAVLPAFNLPYYEGLNRYNDKYWLGIYRRDEEFTLSFLKEICSLCLQTKIGQLCATPWKSLIIKSITETDRPLWNALLARHQVNVRHAANELNFQVEDNCHEGLQLKNYLLKHLGKDDIRTFGICIGIKTRKKSEIFSSILVRRKPLLSIGGFGLFHVYDILCAHDFNPNERTGLVFSSNNPRFLLGEQLRRAIIAFYRHQEKNSISFETTEKKEPEVKQAVTFVYQCMHCLTVYDPATGDPENQIPPGTGFEQLPETYICPLCEAPKQSIQKKESTVLGLLSI